MALPLRVTSVETISLSCAFLCLLCACASGGPAPAALQVVPKVDLGRRAELALVKALADGELTVVHFTAADLSRCVELLETYADAAIGFVDASVAAVAERLKISKILTTDRRHFSLLRDRAGRPYTLLP